MQRRDLPRRRSRLLFRGLCLNSTCHPGAYLQPGEPVLELSDLSEVEIQIGVGDDEILALQDGGSAEVRVQVLPGERFEGGLRASVARWMTQDPEVCRSGQDSELRASVASRHAGNRTLRVGRFGQWLTDSEPRGAA